MSIESAVRFAVAFYKSSRRSGLLVTQPTGTLLMRRSSTKEIL